VINQSSLTPLMHLQPKGIDKIRILRDNNTLLGNRKFIDELIRGAVAKG
jgi:hypothetical protein